MSKAKKKGIKTETLHMTCGEGLGALVTDIAREKVWNDCNYQAGIVFITDGLVGITNDQAREIIDGKMKLVTNEDKQTLEMVKDDFKPPDFKKMREEIAKAIMFCTDLEIEGFYRGRKPLGGCWYDHLPEADRLKLMNFALSIKSMLDHNIWKAHSDAKFLDEWAVELMKANAERIGEKVTWMQESLLEGIKSSAQSRAKPEKAKKRIKQRYKDLDEKTKEDVVRARQDAEKRLQDILDKEEEPEFIKKAKEDAMLRVAQSDLDPKMKERMLRGIDGMYKEVEIKVDRTFEFDTGWLDRVGKYYSCEIGQHIALSDKLVDKFYPKAVGDPEQILENKGWMKCTGAQWYEGKYRPNRAQKRTLERWKDKWPDWDYHERYSY